MNISTEQVQAIRNGQAVEVEVGQTQCVVVRKDIFENVKSSHTDEMDARAWEPLLADLAPDDWEDASNYEDAS